MDERDIEKGFASFHRGLNQVLRRRDVKEFKTHVARHPAQAGKLSHCLGLSDEPAEAEMYKAILMRSALKDLHQEASAWLEEKGIQPPAPRPTRKGRRHEYFAKKRKRNSDRR